jgi:hypothetical protein
MVGRRPWIAVYIMASGRNGALYGRDQQAEAADGQWRRLGRGL